MGAAGRRKPARHPRPVISAAGSGSGVGTEGQLPPLLRLGGPCADLGPVRPGRFQVRAEEPRRAAGARARAETPMAPPLPQKWESDRCCGAGG